MGNIKLSNIYSLGIDSGSRMTKLALLDLATSTILHTEIQETTANHEILLENFLNQIQEKKNIKPDDITHIICTGYGRKKYKRATHYSSEIVCHSRGVNYYNPEMKTIIDIGGQDSKVIQVSQKGKVLDFTMNDKCAAGTGRFLEKVAQFFSIEVSQLGSIAANATEDISISSTCVVFAESEMIGLIAAGESRENIVKAIHHSIVHRILAMNIKIEYPVAFVGGVAKNTGMLKALGEQLNTDIYVPPLPDMTGAIGAALYGSRIV